MRNASPSTGTRYAGPPVCWVAVHRVNPGLIAQHDLICREAAPLSLALLSDLNKAFICSARANSQASLVLHRLGDGGSLRWSLLKFGWVAFGSEAFKNTYSLPFCLQPPIIVFGTK